MDLGSGSFFFGPTGRGEAMVGGGEGTNFSGIISGSRAGTVSIHEWRATTILMLARVLNS